MNHSICSIALFVVSSLAFGQHSPPQASDTLYVLEYLKKSELASGPEESFRWAQKALALSETLQYDRGHACAHAALGDVSLAQKDFVRALQLYENAKPILRRLDDDVQLGRVLKSCGDCYSARSYFRQAFDSYRDAMPLLRKTNQLKLLNECQEAMGNLALDFGQTRGAINLYRRSLNVKQSLGDTAGIVSTTSKISKAYFALMQYDSALYFNTEVQRLAMNDSAALADAAIDAFILLSFQKNMSGAGEAKANAEMLVMRQTNPALTMRLLAATSTFYLAQQDKEKSKHYFDSAATMIREARSVELAITGLSMLAEMSRQNGDYETAYRMLKQLDNYKDIFRTEHMERVSAEIRNAADEALKRKEIEHLSDENALKAEKLNKEIALRRALLRQNELMDSSLERQRQLTDTKEIEANLRNEQLAKEKELSLSLSRENELKQHHLDTERENTVLLWLGIGALLTLGSVIYLQYRKQRNNNAIIRKQADELQVLNKEIHHRVKNNLQVISSMLDLQSQSVNDERSKEIIGEAIQRVQSMAFIHQNLCQGDAVNNVNMHEYIAMLSNHLFHSYNIRPEEIKLHTQIEAFRLHTDSAIPIGMILNELISNSLKYAFKPNNEGDIWVTMKKNGSELFVQVKDNGIGLPPDFDASNTSSFGFEIIQAFAQKLKARMNIDGSNGVDVQLVISKFKMAD